MSGFPMPNVPGTTMHCWKARRLAAVKVSASTYKRSDISASFVYWHPEIPKRGAFYETMKQE
jgi:hypothetical protein